jgi:hypothetical protein
MLSLTVTDYSSVKKGNASIKLQDRKGSNAVGLFLQSREPLRLLLGSNIQVFLRLLACGCEVPSCPVYSIWESMHFIMYMPIIFYVYCWYF